MKVFRTQEGSETWNEKGVMTACEIKFLVIDPVDKNSAMSAALAASPAVMGEAKRTSVRFDGFDADKNAEITVVYEDDSEDEEATMSFDCGGGTKHLTHSIEQKIVKGDVDAGGAINWNGKYGDEMQINGIDVPTAQLRETYTKKMKVSRLTTSFKRKVANLVGKVNSGTFKGWNPGEVMFLGMSYAAPEKKSTRVQVTFNFSIQVNETANIAGVSVKKNGFDYAWAIQGAKADGTTTKIEPKAVYVDKVCEMASFSALGL